MTLLASVKEKQSAKIPQEKILIGRLEGKLKIVKSMLDSGEKIAAIAQFTDLSIEQIEYVRAHTTLKHE